MVLSYNGLPTNKHTVRYIIHRHAELAGVHPIRIHRLRHSHASLLISMGENPLIIKDRLGHEDIKTTLGTYGHLYPNMNRDVATKLTHVLTWQPNKEIEEKKKLFRAINLSRKRECNMAEWKMEDFDLVGPLGKELLLVEVAPKPKYEKNEVTGRNERTGEIDGCTYEVLMKDKKYKSIRVTVLGDKPIITQAEIDKTDGIKVQFENLVVNPYVSNGFIALSFKAENMKVLK